MPSYYAPRYRYRPPRRYRGFGRISSGRMSGKELAVVVAIGASLALASGRAATAHHGTPPAAVADAAVAPAASRAIAYARRQLGCPYVWGGNGPCSAGYDCSGLVTAAWASAGVRIDRTSETEWSSLRHIPASQVRPGDLVFFPGGDGSWAAPGHVAMVISKTQMIQAYAQGVPIEISPLNGDGAGGIVGYARP